MRPETDPLAPHRGRLLGLAYRMLGSRSDAEDVVQDAYLRFAGASDVGNAEAYLVTIVTRLCLDRLKSARARREVYVGPWLPEPVFDAEALSPAPDSASELADDLSFALLLALDRLSAQERAAFLLHDIFETPFPEIARILDRSEASCRQLASRARRAIRHDAPPPQAPPEAHARLLTAFLTAAANGDLTQLTALLRADAIALTDGGGHKRAALLPIRGAEHIARFFANLAKKLAASRDEVRFAPASVNGKTGALVYINGALDLVISCAIDGERIAALYTVRNPDKLRGAPQAIDEA